MPIKKECTICKVRHPEHPKLINVKEFEGKYTQSIEEEEWSGKLINFIEINGEKFIRLKDAESLLLSKEREVYKNIIDALPETKEIVVKLMESGLATLKK